MNEMNWRHYDQFQDELGFDVYDYGARLYDPTIGRFFVIDPMADFVNDQSPYIYADNNPALYTDEYGLGIFKVLGNLFRRIGNAIASVFAGDSCSCQNNNEESFADSWQRMDFPGINDCLTDLFDGGGRVRKTKTTEDEDEDVDKSRPQIKGIGGDPVGIVNYVPTISVQSIAYNKPTEFINYPIINGKTIKRDGRYRYTAPIDFPNSTSKLERTPVNNKTLNNLLKTLKDYPQLIVSILGDVSVTTNQSVDRSTGVRVDGENGTIGGL